MRTTLTLDDDIFELVTTLPLHPYPTMLPTGTTP